MVPRVQKRAPVLLLVLAVPLHQDVVTQEVATQEEQHPALFAAPLHRYL